MECRVPLQLHATVVRRSDEARAALESAQAAWQLSADVVEDLRAKVPTLATCEALDALHARCEVRADETRQLVDRQGAAHEAERVSWEDRLMQRQQRLEMAAQEARRDWHRLSAELEQVQTYVTERALRREHDELSAAVEVRAIACLRVSCWPALSSVSPCSSPSLAALVSARVWLVCPAGAMA